MSINDALALPVTRKEKGMFKLSAASEAFIAEASPYLLALFRIISGLLFLTHGLVTLWDFPRGALPGPAPWLSYHGIAGVLDLVFGLMIVGGIYTRSIAFLASGEMAIGYFTVHAPGSFYPVLNGGELSVLYCFAFLYMSSIGGGALSIDQLLSSQANLGLKKTD